METNLLAVALATIAMFVVGAAWYMFVFAKQWGEMHGFDKLSKKQQQEAQAKMGPFYGAQVVVTIISAWSLAYFLSANPDTPWYTTAFLLWLGFIVPADVSAVIFGGTEAKWITKKIAIMISGALATTLAGAAVLQLF